MGKSSALIGNSRFAGLAGGGGLWGTTGLVGLVGHLKYTTDTTLPGLLCDRYLHTVTSKSHVRSICPPLTTVYWGLKHPPSNRTGGPVVQVLQVPDLLLAYHSVCVFLKLLGPVAPVLSAYSPVVIR